MFPDSRLTRLCVLAALALLPVTRAWAELHTFTDTQGRTLKAEIVGATDRTVKIRREDGQIFEVPSTTFVLDDRKYIEAWAKEQSEKANPVRLRVQVSQTKKTVGKSSDITSDSKEIEAGYRIQIRNESQTAAKGLHIEYRVFKFEDRVGMNNNQRPLKKINGTIDNVSVPSFGQNEFVTNGVKLQVNQLKPDWSYVGGADPRTADSLAGIWLRVINDKGEVVHEYTSAEKLTAEGW